MVCKAWYGHIRSYAQHGSDQLTDHEGSTVEKRERMIEEVKKVYDPEIQ
jgi:hypothetical protein